MSRAITICVQHGIPRARESSPGGEPGEWGSGVIFMNFMYKINLKTSFRRSPVVVYLGHRSEAVRDAEHDLPQEQVEARNLTRRRPGVSPVV